PAEPGIPGADLRLRRRPRRRADEIPDLPGGRDPPGGVCRPPRRSAGHHATLHPRPRAPGAAPPRAILLAPPPLEAPAEAERGAEGGVGRVSAGRLATRPEGAVTRRVLFTCAHPI